MDQLTHPLVPGALPKRDAGLTTADSPHTVLFRLVSKMASVAVTRSFNWLQTDWQGFANNPQVGLRSALPHCTSADLAKFVLSAPTSHSH